MSNNIEHIDFSNMEVREPIADGNYPVELTEFVHAKTRKGDALTNLTFIVTPDDDEFAGRKLYGSIMYTPTTLWKSKEFFEALGYDVEEKFEIDWTEAVGTQLIVKVKQKELPKEDPDDEEEDVRIVNEIKKFIRMKD